MKHDEDIEVLLRAREFCYLLFSKVYAAPLDAELKQIILADETREVFLLVGLEDSRVLRSYAQVSDELSVSDLDEYVSSYNSLMVGPDVLLAPPWESSYVSPDRLVFQRSTLEVREFFRSQGYVSPFYPHEPDDHLSIELSFMGFGAEKLLECYVRNDRCNSRNTIDAQRNFLDEHLLVWVPLFLDQMSEQRASHQFYYYAAELLQLFLHWDEAFLRELIGMGECDDG